MPTRLTRADIERLYPSEWILVGNPSTNEHLEVQSGEVLAHGGDRDAVYRQAIALRPQRFAMLYTGRMPHGTAIVL